MNNLNRNKEFYYFKFHDPLTHEFIEGVDRKNRCLSPSGPLKFFRKLYAVDVSVSTLYDSLIDEIYERIHSINPRTTFRDFLTSLSKVGESISSQALDLPLEMLYAVQWKEKNGERCMLADPDPVKLVQRLFDQFKINDTLHIESISYERAKEIRRQLSLEQKQKQTSR